MTKPKAKYCKPLPTRKEDMHDLALSIWEDLFQEEIIPCDAKAEILAQVIETLEE